MHRVLVGTIDVLVALTLLGGVCSTSGVIRWGMVLALLYFAGWHGRRLLWPALSTAPIDSLTASETAALLQRRAEVDAWMQDVCQRWRLRRPRLLIALAPYVSYAPFSNAIAVPPDQLMQLEADDLRLVVAHELGHAQRRWASTAAWTAVAKIKEEIRADRFALELTGSGIEQWTRVMRITAALEGHEFDEQEVEFTIRLRAIQGWMLRGVPARAQG